MVTVTVPLKWVVMNIIRQARPTRNEHIVPRMLLANFTEPIVCFGCIQKASPFVKATRTRMLGA